MEITLSRTETNVHKPKRLENSWATPAITSVQTIRKNFGNYIPVVPSHSSKQYLTSFYKEQKYGICSAIASETLKCFEEAICSKDHARGPEVLAAWSTQSRTKVPRRGTFTAKQLVSSWLKFLCEALGRSSLRTKQRASSMHLHGLSNKIGSSTRSASSMHMGVRRDSSESVNRLCGDNRYIVPIFY